MDYSTLPGTDLKVSKICVGCWQFNDGQQSADKTWNAQPCEMSQSIVNKAIEKGINFFDTAEAYLNSESVVGRVLESRRRDLVVATKFGQRVPHYTAEEIETSINKSLRLLRTDYIDLLQVHWPIFIAQNLEECVNELKRQQAKGTIRYYGVCNFGPKNLKDFIAAGGKPVTNQIPYNLLWRPVEREVLPICRENNIAVLPYSPLMQGLLTGRFLKVEDVPEGRRRTRLFNSKGNELCRHGQDGYEDVLFKSIKDVKDICDKNQLPMASSSLSWLLKQDVVASVITGASNPGQVESNCQLPDLSQDMVKHLTDATESLKEAIGNNADPWAPTSRIA